MIPPILASTPQWIVVLLAPSLKKPGRTEKIPCTAAGVPCDAHAPENWLTYDQAVAAARTHGHNWTIGFVLTVRDDFFCLDIDHAREGAGWAPWATALVQRMPGCMVEVSQSGEGLHVWGRYAGPPPHRMKRTDLGIELYTELRFIAIGTHQTGEIAERCEALPSLIEDLFKPHEGGADVPDDGPRADWRGPADDEEIIRRARQSRSAGAMFGDKATFDDLWSNRVEVLARAYPGDSDDGTDRSSVDAALFQHLAFWTGCDQARMLRIAERSQLVREKWERADYLPRTITKACRMQREVLQDKPKQESPFLNPPDLGGAAAPPAPVAAPVAPTPQPASPAPASAALTASVPTMTLRETESFVSPADQAALFRGCVYVTDQHRVLAPGGRLLKPDQFKARFGGSSFPMDTRNERVTRNAFEAFTESQVLVAPKADTTFFDPKLPFGAMRDVDGLIEVNTWWPPTIRRTPGDATPMLQHLRKMYPDDLEYQIILYTMACLVQYPGHKAQWAPVLQGAEGNGKTFLARVLQRAIGPRYVYWPRADKLSKDFNAWLERNLLYVVEELMVGDRQELIDHLKPLITAEAGVEIEKKGVDQRSTEIVGNFWFNTNHDNALRKTKNDRRFCLLFSAQQTALDVQASGMTGDYMHNLYSWARGGGFAICTHYLSTLPIPREFDFTQGLQRAPVTRSTNVAIEASRNPTEQEVVDAIERGETGFRGGWVSSGALDRLLDRTGKSRYCPHNQRRKLLQGLDYDWHPALIGTSGRVNNPVLPDAAKVKLFCLKGSPAWGLKTQSEVAAAYTAAQSG